MRRREFMVLAGGVAVAWPLRARAQQSEQMKRIGVLIATPEDDPEEQIWVAAFMEELAKSGWKVGVNLHVEHRWGGGSSTRMQTYAAELAGLAPNVILAQGTPVATALKKTGPNIPVVFVMSRIRSAAAWFRAFRIPEATLRVSRILSTPWVENGLSCCEKPRLHSVGYWSF